LTHISNANITGYVSDKRRLYSCKSQYMFLKSSLSTYYERNVTVIHGCFIKTFVIIRNIIFVLFNEPRCVENSQAQTWDMMPFGCVFYWLVGINGLYFLWSIASSIFKERPTLGFNCSIYSSVGSFLIGSRYCKPFTGFRLYRRSPSQCCHYVQLLWWPQV